MNKEIIDGEEYREVTVRGRTKLIAKDGKALNPIKRNQKVTCHENLDGYLCFGGGVPVHLYVAHGWVDGYFKGAEVHHKDFDNKNNYYTNLKWVTHEENIRYSLMENYERWCKSKQGVHNGRAKFTEEDVIKIRELYDNGMKVADIIRMFYPDLIHVKDYKNIHSNFTNICKRITWKHI